MIKKLILLSCIATTNFFAEAPEKIRFQRKCASVLDESLMFRQDKKIFKVKCIRCDKDGLYVFQKDIIETWMVRQIVGIPDSQGNVDQVPVGTIEESRESFISEARSGAVFGSWD